MSDAEEWFCGCCGRPCGLGRSWCVLCGTFKHLGPPHLHAWDRTWFAQHAEPCPYQAVSDE